MRRILIMCLLGLSGISLEKFNAEASPLEKPEPEMSTGIEDTEGTTGKSKRHGVYPCPQSYQTHNQGAYFAHASSPFVIPSYHHQPIVPKLETIGYQKPVIPKMVYQVIQKPAVHQESYNVQPVVKHQQQVQYVQQPIYTPVVKEQPISYVKSIQPTVSYESIQKSITGYVKPVNTIQKPSSPMSYHPKQYFQPISYYSKPVVSQQPMPIYYSSANYMNKYSGYTGGGYVYQKAKPIEIKHQPIANCEKPHQPQVSYVKIQQPVIQQVHNHQPMLQYAAKYQQPMIHFVEQKVHQPIVQQPVYHISPKIQQPIVEFGPKIHQPIEKNFYFKYQQPMIDYGHAHQHSVSIIAPQVNHGSVNYQSHTTGANQPCHK